MEWASATWEGEWEEEEEEAVRLRGLCDQSSCVLHQTRLLWETETCVCSGAGMDNFGGMNNNMDRFGSSGVGRMNGEPVWDCCGHAEATWEHFHV